MVEAQIDSVEFEDLLLYSPLIEVTDDNDLFKGSDDDEVEESPLKELYSG